jgi:arylsulfatase A-like enzyme
MRLLFFITVTALLASCAPANNEIPETENVAVRPNFLIFMTEDLSARVGAFGDPLATTPHIDNLAATGVRYPNTFTTAGVCAPSRAAHITGMHQIAIGAQHMRTAFYKESPYRTVPPAEVKAYPELLRRAGYFTFTNRKLDYQFSSWAQGSGPFSIWSNEGEEPDWSGIAGGQPFFGLVNVPQTHESQLFTKNFEENHAADEQRSVDPDSVTVPPYYADTPTARETITRQYDNVRAMDEYVGEILQRLKADGMLENTIVIWTTDHGDGLPRAKRELYDSGINVPMIIHWPEQFRPASAVPGGVDGRLVSFVDIGANVLALAGLPVPDTMHGRPTLVIDDAQRQYVFASKDRLDGFMFRERAVRDHRFKYIRNYLPDSPGAVHLTYRDQLDLMRELWELYEQGAMTSEQAAWFDPRPAEELFDLEADPHEVNNVADDPAYAEHLTRMRAALDEWLGRVRDYSEQTELSMAKEFWPAGEQPVTMVPVLKPVRANLVEIAAGTPGASLGYRIDEGSWQVIDDGSLIEMPSGTTLEAKSVRYGWQESAVASYRASADTAFKLRLDGELIVLGDGKAIEIAVSPSMGGELAGLSFPFAGRLQEVLYRARDYSSKPGWRGKAPLLWPATGRSIIPPAELDRYVLGDATLIMPMHGFARTSAWQLTGMDLAADNAAVTVSLEDSPESRKSYPFGFTISAEYRVSPSALDINYAISAAQDNETDMPFSIGNHITLRLPIIDESDPAATTFSGNLDARFVTDERRRFTGEIVESPYGGEQRVDVLPQRRSVSLGSSADVPELHVRDASGFGVSFAHEITAGTAVEAIDFNLWADLEEGFFSPEPWRGRTGPSCAW